MNTFTLPDGRKVRRAKSYVVVYFVKHPTTCHTAEHEWRIDYATDDLPKARTRALKLMRYSKGRVLSPDGRVF